MPPMVNSFTGKGEAYQPRFTAQSKVEEEDDFFIEPASVKNRPSHDNRSIENNDPFITHQYTRPSGGSGNAGRREIEKTQGASFGVGTGEEVTKLEAKARDLTHEAEVWREKFEGTKQQVAQRDKYIRDMQEAHREQMEETQAQHQKMYDLMREQARDNLAAVEDRYQREISNAKETHRQEVDMLKELLRERGGKNGTEAVGRALERIAEDRSSAEVKTALDRLTLDIKAIREAKEHAESSARRLDEQLGEERQALAKKKAELGKMENALESREMKLKDERTSWEKEVRQKETKIKEREAFLMEEYDKIRSKQDHLARKEKDTEEQGRLHHERLIGERKRMDEKMRKVEAIGYEAEVKVKQALDREMDSKAIEEHIQKRVSLLDMREKQIEQRQKDIQSREERLKNDKLEIQKFKDGRDLEKLQLEEERRKLNMLSVKLSDEISQLNKDKSNIELQKTTLSKLRMDYTSDIVSKLNANNLLYRDPVIPLNEYHQQPHHLSKPEVPVQYEDTGDKVDLYNTISGANKFNYEDYMNKLKYNY